MSAFNLDLKNWEFFYTQARFIKLNDFFDNDNYKTLEKMQITLSHKLLTMKEFDVMEFWIFMFYDDRFDEEEMKEYKKTLKEAKISRKEYDKLLKKLDEIHDSIKWF